MNKLCRDVVALGAVAWLSALIVGVAAIPGRADGVVCANRDALPHPANGYVGWWNGASAVCVGPHHVVSAGHVGGRVGGVFWMRGVTYHAVSIRRHPQQDVQLIQIQERLPDYHRLADEVNVGDLGILGGFGRTAGGSFNGGYDWNGAQTETWGANTIDNSSWLIVINFTDPGAPSAVTNESTFAGNDSGGGLFVRGIAGDLRLAGIAVSVSGYNESRYGDTAYCLNINTIRGWLTCAADFDHSGEVSVQDVFSYCAAWSGGDASADIDGIPGVTWADLLVFLNAYLVGC